MVDLNAKIEKYQGVLTTYLESIAQERNEALGHRLHYEVIADPKRNHFQLVRLGWLNYKYVHLVLLHFDIHPDGKIWFQLNNTEMLADQDLVNLGVDKDDIVLGFQPEYARVQPAYAVA